MHTCICCHLAGAALATDAILGAAQPDRRIREQRIRRPKAVVLSENCSLLPLVRDFARLTRGYYATISDGDTTAQPTGGTRQIPYKLEAGEAGWILRQDRVVEF